MRTKHELDRIYELQKEIMKDWQREDTFNEKIDGFFAHMLGDHQASIEGRLYLEALNKKDKILLL